MTQRSVGRSRAVRLSLALAAAVGLVLTTAPGAGAAVLAGRAPVAGQVRVTLRVLVLDDGQPMTRALVAQLDREGVPYDTVNLTDLNRAPLTSASLRTRDKEGPRALYQAVVAPTHAPTQMTPAELAELYAFERDFGVRQVSAYVWPDATVGLAAPGYSGELDAAPATVMAAAKSAGFGYVNGSFAFDNFDSAVTESYGYIASAAPGLPSGTTWTPYVTATAGGVTGSVLGVLAEGRREEMVLTFGQNEYQQHEALLAHGIVQWMTRGVHLGEYRNFLSVHIDDVFMADYMWNSEANCTMGNDCDPVLFPEDAPGATSRMVAADVTVAKNWQAKNGILLDMAYNAAGSVDFAAANDRKDPVLDAFKANRTSFRWLNHTYSHVNLGCEQNFATVPWSCMLDRRGAVVWQGADVLHDQIDDNEDWGNAKGFKTSESELVTGEHSGLAALPQVPTDNPNLAKALEREDVDWIASDASREAQQRPAGKDTLTVPRYPMSVFYNTSTYAAAADEYNWIYTARADGGSGICEDRADITTCIAPLDTTTGYLGAIVPAEVRTMLRHATTVDARPHFAHQTNLTDDRLLYPVLDGVMSQYRSLYNQSTTPMVNPRMADAGELMEDRAAWNAQKNQITAILIGTTIEIVGGNVDVNVPVTAGPNTSSSQLDSAYAGSRSEWIDVDRRDTEKITTSSKDTSYPSYRQSTVVPHDHDHGRRGKASPEIPTQIVRPTEILAGVTPSNEY